MIDAYPKTDRRGVFFLVAILTGVLTVLPAQTEPGRVAPIRDVYVLFIVIDGVPGAIFDEMLDAGRLPNVQRHVIERGCRVRKGLTVFPSVTFSAQVGAITGLYPGHSSVTGIKWYDRYRGQLRHYLSADFWDLEDDLTLYSPKLLDFERLMSKPETPFTRLRGHRTASIQQIIGRDAERRSFFFFELGLSRITHHLPHQTDKSVARKLVKLYGKSGRQPRFTFCCFPDFDCEAHSSGIRSARTFKLLERFDGYLGKIVETMKASGIYEKSYIIVTSDHGNTTVGAHQVTNFNHVLESLGFRPKRRTEKKVDSVVAGSSLNSVAIYFADPKEGWKIRPGYETLRNFPLPRSGKRIDLLLHLAGRKGTDFLLVQENPSRVRVVNESSELGIDRRIFLGGCYYRLEITKGETDPWQYLKHPELGLMIRSGEFHSADEWMTASLATQYPDAVVQAVQVFDSFRAGDVFACLKPGWKVKPSSYRSTHGSLLASDMYVPLLIAGPDVTAGEISIARLTDIYPTILRLFGLEIPFGNIDGRPLDEILPKALALQKDPYLDRRLAILPAMKQLWQMEENSLTESALPHHFENFMAQTNDRQRHRILNYLKRVKSRLAIRLREAQDGRMARVSHRRLRRSLRAREKDLSRMIVWLDQFENDAPTPAAPRPGS